MINYGEALKQQREINGYSQNAVAKATGIKQPMLSYYEANKGLPSIDCCVQLAQFYNCTLDELIGLSEYNAANNLVLKEQQNTAIAKFNKDFANVIHDNSFIQTAKLFKAIRPELRALALGYIVGILQNNGVNTKKILGY